MTRTLRARCAACGRVRPLDALFVIDCRGQRRWYCRPTARPEPVHIRSSRIGAARSPAGGPSFLDGGGSPASDIEAAA